MEDLQGISCRGQLPTTGVMSTFYLNVISIHQQMSPKDYKVSKYLQKYVDTDLYKW